MTNGGGDDDHNNPNRTVFRPSPLQGLRNRPADGGATSFSPQGGQSLGGQSLGAPPPAQPAMAARPMERLADDDIPRPATALKVRNTMMSQAAGVLALAASVRSGRAQIPLPELHSKAVTAITAFDRANQAAGYPEEQRQRAKYAVCATLDDIAQNLPGQIQDGAEWARRSMTVQFFSENIGGDRFWQLVDDMLSRPAQNADLIELYHACLAAGFEGRFRVMPDGKRRLDEVMTQLYAALSHVRSLSQIELSPHWRGEKAPLGKVEFWAPLALAAGAALGFLFLVYVIFRLILLQTGGPSMDALKHINPDAALTLSRPAAAPPALPASGQMEALQKFLAPQIAAHQVVVLEDQNTVRVRTTIGELFKSGSEQLNAGQQPLFDQIGLAIQQTQQGPVKIEGDANSDKLSSLKFPDNFALSKARADTVAAIIRSKLADPSRVTTDGLGDSQPIASNDTAAGKAQNRRVEIIVQRSST